MSSEKGLYDTLAKAWSSSISPMRQLRKIRGLAEEQHGGYSQERNAESP
jgi:hypothetical protein